MSKYPEPPPPCPRCKDASHITIHAVREIYEFRYWCRVCKLGFN